MGKLPKTTCFIQWLNTGCTEAQYKATLVESKHKNMELEVKIIGPLQAVTVSSSNSEYNHQGASLTSIFSYTQNE